MPLKFKLFLAFALLLPAAHAEQRLLPSDDAPGQPAFLQFRATLINAVVRRDTQFLLKIVDENIRNSFGGDDGRAYFLAKWKPERPGSRLWPELAAVLKLGGCFSGNGNFEAPYTFCKWPEAVDSFNHAAIISNDVAVKVSPLASAKHLSRLSFSIVELADVEDTSFGWTAIRVADKTVGYVEKRHIRSPIDYRAVFQQADGRWQLVAFLAGD
ncbi:MAG: hypothetical protein V4695_01215 [Pseudomonadota bacterium]